MIARTVINLACVMHQLWTFTVAQPLGEAAIAGFETVNFRIIYHQLFALRYEHQYVPHRRIPHHIRG